MNSRIACRQPSRISVSAMLCGILFCALAAAFAGQSVPATNSSQTEPPAFACGEILAYTMDFWMFRGAAAGTLSSEPHPQGYRVVFEAETKGLIAVIAGKRREVMESIMTFDTAARRFRPLRFQETFSHGGNELTKTLCFDYDRGLYTCRYLRNGRSVLNVERKLPRAPFDDLLTLLCNLRAGAYGDIHDRTLRVCVLAKDRPSFVTVSFSGQIPRAAPPQGRHHALVSMDRDMTQARSKTLRGWFSDDMVPVGGVIEDAYFFGDLSVRLASRAAAARNDRP